jgi:predicted PurR-regulated permease PerM
MAATSDKRSIPAGGLLAPDRATSRAVNVLAVLGIIAALYFGRALFIPLAVAILLTFVLAPLVRLLRRGGLGRVPSVLIVVVLAFTVIFGFGALVGQQMSQLTERLPLYQYNIQQKIQTVREKTTQGGAFARISDFLRSLNREIENPTPPPSAPAAAPSAEQEQKPMPVEVRSPPPTPIEVTRRILDPLIEPLTSAAIIAIFVIFFLLQREDLRDRLIKLAGSHDLRRTTEAINDGAKRLSRYFLVQTSLNLSFGAIVAAGLFVIGVPNPLLWGTLAAVLRFVPYVGAFLAAAFPIALSVAVDPGWMMALWTIALFIVVEPIIGQVIEPLAYGHSTGISPVAVIVSATFWTWLWGPIGLLLSTPLAVCLGVLGRHIEWLHFVDVMIGDDPPLTPAQSFYQRALANDFNEAVAQAEQFLRREPLVRYYDQVVLQGLLLAQIDVRRGTLDQRHVARINDVVRGLMLELADHADEPPPESGIKALRNARKESVAASTGLPIARPEELPPGWAEGKPVLCIGGPGPFDDVISAMLAQILEKHGIGARIESDAAVSALNIARMDAGKAEMIALSYLYLGHSTAHLGYSVRRIRRKIPGAKILAGLWCHEKGEQIADALNRELSAEAVPEYFAYSLLQAVGACIAVATSEQEGTADGAPGTPRTGQSAA